MLKNGNGVQLWVAPGTRDSIKTLAQQTGKPQHEVVAEAAELYRKRQERLARKGGVQGG